MTRRRTLLKDDPRMPPNTIGCDVRRRRPIARAFRSARFLPRPNGSTHHANHRATAVCTTWSTLGQELEKLDAKGSLHIILSVVKCKPFGSPQ